MPANSRATWRNPRILSTLLLVFLCGSLAGALTIRYGLQPKAPAPAIYWNRAGKEDTLQHFIQELDLSSDQADEIAGILDDFMVYYHTLQAQMDEVRANGKVRILRVLDPDQQVKFQKMLEEAPVGQIH